MNRLILAGLALLLLFSTLYSQQPVNPRNTHERLLCIVPMVGRGTPDDPRRPMFAPAPAARGKAPSREGIIAYTYQVSDDGRYALAEFVALDRTAFKPILDQQDRSVDVKAFVKGKDKKADVEAEFRKLKRDFDADRSEVRVP